MNHDLKMDILMMVHNCAHHPSIVQTTRNVAALAWFPSVKTYTAEYFDSCSTCLPRRKSHRSVGISIMAARRFKAVQAGFVILDNDVAQKTDMTAILTLICMASRMAMTLYAPVKPIGTINAAFQLLIRTWWYPMFGLPAVIRSDKGAAFATGLMASIRQLLGIRLWDSFAAGDAQHHSQLENKHKILDTTLDMAMNKCDLNSDHDLDFYVSAAMARNNLDMLTDTATAFEVTCDRRNTTHYDGYGNIPAKWHIKEAPECT